MAFERLRSILKMPDAMIASRPEFASEADGLLAQLTPQDVQTLVTPVERARLPAWSRRLLDRQTDADAPVESLAS